MTPRFECEMPEELRKRFEPVNKREAVAPPKRRKSAPLLLMLAFAGFVGWAVSTLKTSPQPTSPQPVSQGSASRVINNRPAPLPMPMPEVRRAEPVVLKAEPVPGATYNIRMPDGTPISVTFRGYLKDVGALPRRGGAPGDMYGAGNAYWVLTLVPGSTRLGWVDP